MMAQDSKKYSRFSNSWLSRAAKSIPVGGSLSFLKQSSRTHFGSNINLPSTGGAELKNEHEIGHAVTPTINVILFGETGVRRNAVINLIARKEFARVSSDVNGHAMDSTQYDIPIDDMTFSIFETIGLEEPQLEVDGYLKAIEKAYELIMRLSAAGGIHLLLFCIPTGQVTTTMQSNYRLFCKYLCSMKVPVALVFTGFGREVETEDWWRTNRTHMERRGIRSVGHTCITALRDDAPGEDAPGEDLKFMESQRKIHGLLKTHALENEPFSLEPHSWFARLGRGLKSLISERRIPMKQDVMKVLVQRCKLDYNTAEKIIEMMEKGTINVVLFGESGSGKGSVINFIAQEEVLKVSSDVNGCAMDSTQYDVPINDMIVSIFDTTGLEEPQIEVDGYLKAIEKAYELIMRLSAAGGIHLLLLCMPAGLITTTTQSNYRLFCKYICSTKVPVALVFTGFGRGVEMEDWWRTNQTHMERHGIRSVDHACITTLRDDDTGEDLKFMESQRRIRELLKTRALENEPFSLEPHSWFAKLGRGLKSYISDCRNPKKQDILKVLTQHCKLDHDTAERIAETMEKGTINVVLFGETGVGKSSVINLIARKEIAKVSADVDACTMHSTQYNIPIDDMTFTIFDTIGLEEPQMGVNGYLKAIEKAYELIMRLSAAGGIHLLLFCMRGGRITATTQSNYRLFCECLCSAKVPVALVFTGLEREVEMENWWKRNQSHIVHYGIKSVDHACVTAVRDDAPGEDLKFMESQRKIRELLKTRALEDEAFSLEPHSWFARLGRGLKSFISKRRNPKKRDIMRVLTQRCKLDHDTAKKIAEMMEKDDGETKDEHQDPQKGEQGGEAVSSAQEPDGKDESEGITMGKGAGEAKEEHQNPRAGSRRGECVPGTPVSSGNNGSKGDGGHSPT